MIQLKVYDDQNKSSQHWLDLYETEPIKLNLSVEDITNAEAKSVFSRTFRVPATSANNEFFNHAFLIDGVDYDVTVKKPAEIIVDGAEFRQGHIRLQRIFINGAQDKIDYEIIFLGETRDFSSAIGDATMCSLNMPELSHVVNNTNIEASWLAYPEGSLTAGLINGDVLYPLIDFGNTYDENGSAEQTRVAVGGTGSNFTSNGHPLEVERMKPMIRARKCFGKIFENTGYTFTSTFLDSAFFKQVYLSAFGNEASIGLNLNSNSTNIVSATDSNDEGGDEPLLIAEAVSDPSSGNTNTPDGKNYQYGGSSFSYYVAPVQGNYIIRAQSFYAGQGGQSPPFSNISGRLKIQTADYDIATGTYGPYTDTSIGAFGSGGGTTISVQGVITLGLGDKVRIYGETANPGIIEQSVFRNKEFDVVSAPGNSLPNASLDCEYKQIDFIKDILTTFRLVMAPDPADGKNFIIEPFINYIASGELYDWSDKLIRDKDFVIEPLFNTQSDQIDFTHKDDGDWINIYHTQAYKNVFGYLEFDSGNELLKGTRKIETTWAPTPLAQIESAPNTSEFIIPQLVVKNDGENNPIKPKSRLLFYNGLQPVGNTSYHWYLAGAASAFTTYPLVSQYNEWPMDQDTQVLNWNVDIPYWGTQVTGLNGLVTDFDLYTTYWSGYIQSLYNTRARRVTAHFTLNNVDLQNFSFDDIVFVDGAYYRPEKINDAQIGVTGPVKVQLIKLIDYKPVPQATDALNYTTTPQGPTCFNGANGQITYVFSTPVNFPVAWSSTSGDSGTFNINPGLIDNQTPGTYTITVVDNQGRTDSQQITIPQSTATELTSSATVTEPTDCNTSDGAVTITAAGGTAPYTILWTDGSTNFTRTGLASATYSFTITDNVGCTNSGSQLVSCQVVIPSGDISYIREYYVGGLCQGETVGDSIDVVMVRVNSGNSPAEPTDGYYCYDGDWASLQLQYGTSPGTLVPMDQNNTCGQSDWYYSATSFNNALRRPFDGCFCPNTNGFSGSIQLIGTNPYIFVAQI